MGIGVGGPILNRAGIEDDDVGRKSRLEEPAIGLAPPPSRIDLHCSGMPSVRRPLARVALFVTVCAIALVSSADAQRGYGQGTFREGSFPPQFPPEDFPDGDFTICKLMYTQVRREAMGIGWLTDYPYAAVNLMTRASELTKIRVSRDASHNPYPWAVRLTDEALFQCPMVVASDVGTMGIDDAEAARLREYLLKGGFLWVDDFWGTEAWDQWVSQIRKVVDLTEYPIVDVPPTHPLFRTVTAVGHVPQVTNIQFWRRSGGTETSERGADSIEVHTRAINDAHGRIMVLMTHNTDLGDSWEREGEDPGFFYQFSPPGYAVGINVLVYTLTH